MGTTKMKTRTELLFRLIFLASLLPVLIFASGNANALVVTKVSISAPGLVPNVGVDADPECCIAPGTSKTFTVDIEGTGIGDFVFQVYDQDPISDDLLVSEQTYTANQNIDPVWKVTIDFILSCIDGVITGPDGTSGEAIAEVFVLLETPILGSDLWQTNNISVKCCEPPVSTVVGTVKTSRVPEPATTLLLVLGLCGLGWSRRVARKPIVNNHWTANGEPVRV